MSHSAEDYGPQGDAARHLTGSTIDVNGASYVR